MINIFIDTSAFFASVDKKDINFEKARAFFQEIKGKPIYSLYTTNHIFSETVTTIRSKVGIQTSIEFGNMLLYSTRITSFFISQEMELKAWSTFAGYTDKDPSFVDCTSFAVMKELNITKAFTFDDHFKQFGFEVVPLL